MRLFSLEFAREEPGRLRVEHRNFALRHVQNAFETSTKPLFLKVKSQNLHKVVAQNVLREAHSDSPVCIRGSIPQRRYSEGLEGA